MEKRKKITMQALADSLQISRNTVYKALNDKQGISNNLKAEVVAAARKLGYPVKSDSTNNKAKKSIAVLIKEEFFSEATYYSKIFVGIESAAREQGYGLYFAAISVDQEESASIPSHLTNEEFVGAIIIGKLNDTFITKLNTIIPVVVVDYYNEELEVDAILIDNKRGIYKAFEHLTNMGHKDVGFIGKVDLFPSFMERYQNFLNMIKMSEISTRESWLLTKGDGSFWDIDYLKERIQALDEMPDAFLCVNDRTAIPLMKVLSDLGYQIPRDVSIIGFDNVDSSSLMVPSLTTLNVYKETMGTRAVSHLMWRIKNLSEPIEKIRINVSLIVRQSVQKLN